MLRGPGDMDGGQDEREGGCEKNEDTSCTNKNL